MSENIDQKSINNAAISYGMLFISWLLFFNKNNKYINNSFVKNHIKSSIVLHSLLFLNYLIFISLGLFNRVGIFGISLNIIIADIFFLLILLFIIRGIYNALNSKIPDSSIVIKKSTGIGLDINNDNSYDEKDKLAIIFSYVPFAGYILSSKYNNEKIVNILKLNVFITFFISIIYILKYDNIANLLFLIYTIYIVFGGIYLYGKDSFISINLPSYFLPSVQIIKIKSFTKYLYNYFSGNFIEYNKIENEEYEKLKYQQVNETSYLETKEKLKLNQKLIYLPIINLIFLFQKENNYSIHIKNGITITTLFIIFLLFMILGIFSGRIFILFLFPICFGIGNLYKTYYKMPYIYDLYYLFNKTKNFILNSKHQINQKRKEVNEINLKVKI